jgi:NitT/TauT family transport system substrate-binding protein
VLALLEQYRLTARPTATGAASSTLTQVMSGQIEVGYSAPPFGLAQLDRGQIRIVARGDDVAIFKDQTVRVLIAHPQVLQTRRAAIARYLRGYRETIAWMYSDPEALRTYARFVNIPEAMARRTRDGFFPMETVNPDRVLGMDRIMRQAVRFKYIAAPLNQAQVAQLIQIPPRR